MSKNPRYERRGAQAPHPQGELATGIPITDDVPAGSPQLATFEAAVQEAAEIVDTDEGPIEDRDNRGAVEGNGKRIPITEVENLAGEMTGRLTRDEARTRASLDGDTLTVAITTKHGTSKASADVKNWTASGVKSALEEIEAEIRGDAPTDSNAVKG